MYSSETIIHLPIVAIKLKGLVHRFTKHRFTKHRFTKHLSTVDCFDLIEIGLKCYFKSRYF